MRKAFHLIICMLVMGYATRGQSSFGIKAGLNLANQDKTISIPQVPATTLNTKPFLGYQLGLFYKTKPYNQFSVSAEANFSVIGSGRVLTTSDGQTHNTREKLGYLELPLIVQYSFKKIYFGIGPGVGFKLFSKITNFENSTYDISYYQAVDAAGNLLAGFKVSRKVDVNLRYSHGFVNIYKDPGYARTTNKFFNLSVLYSLK